MRNEFEEVIDLIEMLNARIHETMLSLRYQVQAGYFATGTRLLFIHTGGMQGRRAQQATLQKVQSAPANAAKQTIELWN